MTLDADAQAKYQVLEVGSNIMFNWLRLDVQVEAAKCSMDARSKRMRSDRSIRRRAQRSILLQYVFCLPVHKFLEGEAMSMDAIVLVLSTLGLLTSNARSNLWNLLLKDGILYFVITFSANTFPAVSAFPRPF